MAGNFNYLYYVNVLCYAARLKGRDVTPEIIRLFLNELESKDPKERTEWLEFLKQDPDYREGVLNMHYLRTKLPLKIKGRDKALGIEDKDND